MSFLKATRIVYLVVGLLALSAWEMAANWSSLIRLLLSSPSLSWTYFMGNAQELAQAAIRTGVESILGLVVATGIGFGALLLCLYWNALRRWVVPPIVVSQVVPLITLAPFFIMAFGFGPLSKIAMAATICFFPIFVNINSGVSNVPQSANDLAFIYGFSRTGVIFRILLPLSTPSLFSGLKIAATLSVVGSVVAEFNGADIGLGKNLYLAARRLEPELMITSLALVSALGGAMYGVVALVERKLGFWYIFDTRPSSKSERKYEINQQ